MPHLELLGGRFLKTKFFRYPKKGKLGKGDSNPIKPGEGGHTPNPISFISFS